MGRRRASTFAAALALALLAAGGREPPPRADAPVAVGASFSPERALATGLDDLVAFRRLEAMRFAVIRLAVSWDVVDSGGYGHLDRLVAEAERSGQPLVLSVGMKAPGWPEFYVPARLAAAGPDDPWLRAAALGHVRRT